MVRFRQPFPLPKFFIAAFVNRYRRLTDIAAEKIFSLRSQIRKATLDATGLFQGDGLMIRTDKSVTFLTGMIIAALYVIMLVGFSRESYMRRDALTARPDAWTVVADAASQMCRIDRPVCLAPWISAADGGAARLRPVRFDDGLPSR